jgi:hypothetical protein
MPPQPPPHLPSLPPQKNKGNVWVTGQRLVVVGEVAGGGGSPCLYQNADFSNGRIWLCHTKIWWRATFVICNSVHYELMAIGIDDIE